jgi:hypothetical protein
MNTLNEILRALGRIEGGLIVVTAWCYLARRVR